MGIRGVLRIVILSKLLLFLYLTSIVSMLYIFVYGPRQYTFSNKIPVDVAVDPQMTFQEEHRKIVSDYYNSRKDWATSNIGTYLFKHGLHPNTTGYRGERFFNILIWQHYDWLKHRHVHSFSKHEKNPLQGCSVSNCRFSRDVDISSADVLLVHLQRGFLPKVTSRSPEQIWIFWSDESPKNTFSLAYQRPSDMELSNIFNWSMTYRTDADVPIPYGRTEPLPSPRMTNFTISSITKLVPHWKEKKKGVLAAILISNACAGRMQFLLRLRKRIKVDIFGGCATDEYNRKRCPGHFRVDCKILSKYLFYIVMENSKCREYITEKSFHHAYGKGAIPVFVGTFLEDCNKLLPPNSFLHIDNFETPELLAEEMFAISKNESKLLYYHAWRNHFNVISEHGYFGTKSSQFCNLCEALNFNPRSQKVYGFEDIRRYFDTKIQCFDGINNNSLRLSPYYSLI